MLAVGCTGLNSNNIASQPAAISSQDKLSLLQPTETISPQQIKDVSQDIKWNEYVQRYSPLLTADFSNLATALNNYDNNMLATVGQNIFDDTQKALDENKNYTVSSKYQEAQKEWELALKDYNSAGIIIIQVAKDGKAGNPNLDNLQKAMSIGDSGTAHSTRMSALLQAAEGTTSITTNTDGILIYASSKSDVYHVAGCRYVSQINPDDLVTFSSRQEAEAAGYRSCEVCGG